MKKSLTLSLIAILSIFTLSSCGTTMYQLNNNCNLSSEELFPRISQILINEGFIIKTNDAKNGYLQAETIPKFNIWIGMSEVRYWIIQKNEQNGISATSNQPAKPNLIAYAKVVYTQTNIFGASTGGAETYYNDKTSKDWQWYWNVRNALENLCGDKIKIIEIKHN